MSYTVDMCVFLSALSKPDSSTEPDVAASRAIFLHLAISQATSAGLGIVAVPIFQPVGFMLEMMSTWPRKLRSPENDSEYATHGFPFRQPKVLGVEFVDITLADISSFWTAPRAGITRVAWTELLMDVRPAYDLEYAIAAHKSGSLLVSTDKRVLALRAGMDVKHPSETSAVPPDCLR